MKILYKLYNPDLFKVTGLGLVLSIYNIYLYYVASSAVKHLILTWLPKRTHELLDYFFICDLQNRNQKKKNLVYS